MNIKNSQIRAHARHLLDDNVFGKDWVKAALTHILIDAIIALISKLLFLGTYLTLIVLAFSSIHSLALRIILFFFLILIPLVVIYGLIGPVSVGTASVYIDLVRGEKVRIRNFFYGFKHFFSNAVLGAMYILQVALWSLLFVVPGIYVAYSYALVFHIKRDNPTYNWKQCFDESERLMDGNRWKLFTLQISHLGWFIVGTAFVFIGTFWAEPYLHTSTAIFYEEIKSIKSSR